MSTSNVHELTGAPTAVGVTFDDAAMRVQLADGRELSVPLAWFPRLARATRAELEQCRLLGGGIGLSWQNLDEDISVAGLLRGNRGR
jgi:hypothetical protein